MSRANLLSSSETPPSSIIIEAVEPELNAGRYPIKREVGDVLHVSADIVKDGHDKIAAVLRFRRWNDAEWLEAEMSFVDNDRWSGSFVLADNTRYCYTIQAFPDLFATWQDEIAKKTEAGLDVAVELTEGQVILTEALTRAVGDDREIIEAAIASIEQRPQASSVAILLAEPVTAAMGRCRSRAGEATYQYELEVIVDRVAARYASWYALFVRSFGTVPGQSATFAEAAERLPALAAMGFDVIYLMPIHPIGHSHRKGPNNSLVSGPDDPGVPYAIGNESGGHDAVEPSLGKLDDFHAYVLRARDLGMEVALDLAINASPDHPWVREHPNWFHHRPDGTIKYAENPPKKYQDIYPINFANDAWRELWHELKRIILFWIEQGVLTFRVDNPHTKPTAFWEWLIREVHRTHPDAVFLSEAFTRPKVMKALAKAGFAQSYTYFTWRNFKQELTDYLIELTQTDVREYMRGNFFTNTHDILPFILQEGGRPAFKMRLALAATLSSVYGIYSGYELCEATPVPGKEEYLNSEKYEYKVWDWDRPGNIIDYVTAINQMRRDHPALQEYENLEFVASSDDNVISYFKAMPDLSDIVLAVVNLDPFGSHETELVLPLDRLGLPGRDPFRAVDLLGNETHMWSGALQRVVLDPEQEPARFFHLSRWTQIDFAEPCY